MFECNTWLSRDHDDGEIAKEFAVNKEDGEPCLPSKENDVETKKMFTRTFFSGKGYLWHLQKKIKYFGQILEKLFPI